MQTSTHNTDSMLAGGDAAGSAFTHLFDGNKSLREFVRGFRREEALRGLRKKGKEEERNKRHEEDFGGEHSITPTAEVTRRDGQMFHHDCSRFIPRVAVCVSDGVFYQVAPTQRGADKMGEGLRGCRPFIHLSVAFFTF